MRFRKICSVAAVLLLVACNDHEASPPATSTLSEADAQGTFWASLEELCGQAFEGTIVESSPPDTSFAGKALVMHVRQCEDGVVRVPFFVGDNRSRTWVISRLPGGLRLKHDHRHEDGSEDPITQYGGDTAELGSSTRQEFHADAHTATLIPAAAANVWTIEIHPGQSFVYALRRNGTERRFRVDFDLTRPIPLPPAPWGASPRP